MTWTPTSCRVLVLYDNKGQQIEALATELGRGVSRIEGVEAVVQTIDEATRQDLLDAEAVILGCPNWSGVTGSLKGWLDEQGDLWEEGVMAGKVGAAFTTGRGRHSGVETTLLSLVHWMLACGMVIVGLPWSDRMRTAGSYYGATAAGPASPEDLDQARELGARVAALTLRLSGGGAG